jgi:circadian clock protein KaiB
MKNKDLEDKKKIFDETGFPEDNSSDAKYVLQLYITGATPSSTKAIRNLKKICEEYLHDRYELEIIDLYQHKTLSRDEQIFAAPTLIKKLPVPIRKLIGDLSDTEKVLLGLNLKKK